MKRILLAIFVVVGMAHLALATTTDVLKLTSGTQSSTITDCATGICLGATTTNLGGATLSGDLSTAAGVIIASGALDGWTIFVETGVSNSPGLSPFGIDLTSFTATCTGGGCPANDLTIEFSDINFTDVVSGFTTAYSATVTGGGSTTQKAWWDVGNGLFTKTVPQLIGTVGPLTAPSGAGSANGGGPAGPGAYSLTIQDKFTHGAAVSYSTDGNITGVPEPASLTLLASGLLGFASFARKKIFKS